MKINSKQCIHNIKNYGKINIRLNDQMKIKQMTSYHLAKVTGLNYNTIRSYRENQPITRVDLDVLARLCYVLDCKVDDILSYDR